MGIKVSLEHRTSYTFDRPVRIHPHVVRLRPAPHTRTTIEAYSMRVSPGDHWVNWQQDAFGNFLARLVFNEPATELSIVVGLIADMDAINPFDFFVEEHAEYFPFTYSPQLAADLEPYLRPVDEGETGSGPGASVRDWVRGHAPQGRPRTIDFLIGLNQALRQDVGYTIRMEPGVQTPDHTLGAALGSCRDSAWLLVSILREYGLAARFVSGYLIQLAQDVPSLDGPSGPPADFTDLHAWTEVYLPGAGWVGLDATSGLFAGEGHIPLAATPHPVSSAPITGATDPVNATLDFSNTVHRIHEDPRVTLPYTDIQWQHITAAGADIDARTQSAGIDLTVGGEPTFVSIDDQTAPEWNTEADGPQKRERAADLAQRLRRIYAPTGLAQYRQGKWYPGEPLPRWEIALLWRGDAAPLWRHPDFLDNPWLPPHDRPTTPPNRLDPTGSGSRANVLDSMHHGAAADSADAIVAVDGAGAVNTADAVISGDAMGIGVGVDSADAIDPVNTAGAVNPSGATDSSGAMDEGEAIEAGNEGNPRDASDAVDVIDSGSAIEVGEEFGMADSAGSGERGEPHEKMDAGSIAAASGKRRAKAAEEQRRAHVAGERRRAGMTDPSDLAEALADQYGAGGAKGHRDSSVLDGEQGSEGELRQRINGIDERAGSGSGMQRRDVVGERRSPQEEESAAVATLPRTSRPGLRGSGAGLTESAVTQAESETARAVLAHIAQGLGLPDSQVRPAYEDSLLRTAAKVAVPYGEPVDPEEDLVPGEDSAQARKELLARLDSAVGEPAAYVLSLYRRADEAGWASADWRLRRGRIVLTEGDSPAGLRLPLRSIAWNAPPPRPEADPFAPRLPLASDEPPAIVESAARAPITALVAEVRADRLFVFLPPIEEFGAFCDLVRRVEEAVVAAGQPVVLEGYAPPVDGRLHSLSITPDPGVIEVNVQPTSSFAEQSRLLETLYEQARLARLSTESFDVDGTDRGTGGGNHITLGGRTPARSPLLRRPDLLVSMLTYWQRHPALSYLFSGRFIGPTSQAPRVDEGREDVLYELEIAFAEIARLSHRDSGVRGAPAAGQPAPPWAVDRALRHLLTDLTGNTHRAEFCIDKLYSPDSVRGRLGLVELRGFEMPPHFRMAMVQSLLVRALVLRFWEQPYTAPLLRHGANLHGRYLLPHFLQADIADVAADLHSHGIEFDISWLDPFFEFRFPRFGTVVLGDMEVELRGAIEPWNTLGEQTTVAGTARYVDSSVERLQVRVVGADRGRYALTCNDFPLPLIPAGRADVQVAGVRYRAWQPPESLHPTITVDAPLVFDVVDLDTGLSRGGCTYHVSHPGGMFYAGPPVNSMVAQSRRNRRFEATGHTPGPVDIAELRARMAVQATDIGAPGILDLRRARTVWGVGDR
ncbi:transglutaminase family protein [Nocardia sp. NPDC020380]|uniref:transglutaminase family protein n=1 Tax=Nocardia sp. NPDC020380 TaxID=3364309 RepID=UPI0037BCC524